MRKKNEKPKGNKVGNTQSKEFRDEALKTLDRITKEREQVGYRWVRKLGTSKQIHPDKVEDHLKKGWKLTGNG